MAFVRKYTEQRSAMLYNQKSVLDSENEDIEDILEELDNMTLAEMTELDMCIDERLRQERLQRFGLIDNSDDEDDSLFSNLSLDYQRQPLHTRNDARNRAECPSPIQRSTKHGHRDIRITAPALDKREEHMRAFDPESHDLLNKATRSLCSLYSLLDKIDILVGFLVSALVTLEQPICTPSPVLGRIRWTLAAMSDIFKALKRFAASALGTKNIAETSADCTEHELLPTRSTSHITEEPLLDEKENYEVKEPATSPHTSAITKNEPVIMEKEANFQAIDKRFRPVHAPAPGRALYKHDPVVSHRMEEWKRRPTPDEQKRLALRWKVRDYMMSRKKFPGGGPVQHPKDWSPKPYL